MSWSLVQFPLQMRGVGPTDPAEWEDLAEGLRHELLDVGAAQVEQVSAQQAPADTRGLVSDIAGVLDLVVTASQTAETLAKIVRAIQQWMAARAKRVTLEVAGIEVGTGEYAVRRIVDRLVSMASRRGGEVGVRRALVIANLRYEDAALRGLRAPAADARALDRVLGDPDICQFDVELCVDESETTIRRRIADFFADRDRDDLLLLHYSGHGIKDGRGRLFLAARDTELRRLSATAVPASFLNDQMTESASRRVVLVLDCCYSGAFARGGLVRADRAVHVAEEFGGQGRVVLTASSATEYAFDGDQLTESEGRPSVFTSALVRGLQTGAADLNNDGEITIDEVYDYTYREVRQDQPGQAPMKWTFGVEGPLVLARSVRGAELPQSLTDDLRSNRIGLRLEAIDELHQLLGSGTPGMRQTARDALEQLRDHDDSNRVRSAAADALTTAGQTPTLPAKTSIPAAAPPPANKAPTAPAASTPRSDPPAPTRPTPQPPVVEATATPTEPVTPSGPARVPIATRFRRIQLPRTRRSRLVAGGLVAVLVAAGVTTAILVKNADSGGGGPAASQAGPAPSVLSMAFSPDGKTLATGQATGSVRLWNLATGQPTGQPLGGYTSRVVSVAFSPDGKTLAGASEDTQARLWNLATGQLTVLDHPYEVYSVAFSPDGKTLATGSADGVRLWSPTTGQLVGQPLTGHGALSVAFSPDGKALASGSSGEGTVRLWNVPTTQTDGEPLTGHTSDVVDVAFSPDGKTLASASNDKTVRLWNLATRQPIGQPLTSHTDLVRAVAFSPDGKILASAGRDGPIRLWNPVTGQPTGQLPASDSSSFDDALSVAFSPDGKTLAAGHTFGDVQLWNPATGQIVGTLSQEGSPSALPSPTS